jgi:hypothetical protein
MPHQTGGPAEQDARLYVTNLADAPYLGDLQTGKNQTPAIPSAVRARGLTEAAGTNRLVAEFEAPIIGR